MSPRYAPPTRQWWGSRTELAAATLPRRWCGCARSPGLPAASALPDRRSCYEPPPDPAATPHSRSRPVPPRWECEAPHSSPRHSGHAEPGAPCDPPCQWVSAAAAPAPPSPTEPCTPEASPEGAPEAHSHSLQSVLARSPHKPPAVCRRARPPEPIPPLPGPQDVEAIRSRSLPTRCGNHAPSLDHPHDPGTPVFPTRSSAPSPPSCTNEYHPLQQRDFPRIAPPSTPDGSDTPEPTPLPRCTTR